jgi:hypothetical protein
MARADSTWKVPENSTVAIACVGEDDCTDAILKAALATRRSLGPIEEVCRVRVQPEGQDVRIYSTHGEPLARLAMHDADDLMPQIQAGIAADGELWCDARIRGTESLASQWRMQLWVYFEQPSGAIL